MRAHSLVQDMLAADALGWACTWEVLQPRGTSADATRGRGTGSRSYSRARTYSAGARTAVSTASATHVFWRQCWRLPGFTISGNLPNTHPENLKWETSGKSHFPKFAAKRVTFLQHCPACTWDSWPAVGGGIRPALLPGAGHALRTPATPSTKHYRCA